MNEDIRKKEFEGIRQWLRTVDGVIVGNKRKVTYKPVDFDPKNRDIEGWLGGATEVEVELEKNDEDVCVIEIPRRHLIAMYETQDWYAKNAQGFSIERFDKIIRNHFEEKQLRKMHPGVKEAWEKYKIILSLTSSTDFDGI